MNVISVPGQSGRSYTVRIAGETPTPDEQAKINSFVAQQDAQYAQLEQRYVGSATPDDTGPDTSFLGAVRFGLDQPLESMATTARALGGNGIGDFLSGLTDAPENYQSATEGFMNEGGRFFDLSYLPRAVVEQGGQFAGSILSRAGGAALGATVGGPGGAVVGAAVAPALFEAVQLLGPVAIERARNNGREEPNADDWLWAAGTSAGSGALNAIAPNLSGYFKRVLIEGGTEGLQSVIQQVGETAQTEAGLDINARQAVGEGLLGAGAAGVLLAPTASAERKKAREDEERKAAEELEADQAESIEEATNRLKYGLDAVKREENEQAISSNTLYLPDPNRLNPQEKAIAANAIAEGSDAAIGTGSDAPTSKRSFELEQYDAAVERIKSDGKFSLPAIQSAVAKKTGAKVPASVARDIRDEMVRRGVLRADTQSQSGYVIEPDAGDAFTQEKSYRDTLDQVDRAIEKARKEKERATQEARRLRQTGAKPAAIRAELIKGEQADASIRQAETVRADISKRLENVAKITAVPTVEAPRSMATPGQQVVRGEQLTPDQRALAVTRRADNIETTIAQYNERIKEQKAILSRMKAEGKKVQLSNSERQQMQAIEGSIKADTAAVQALQSRLKNKSADIQIAREQAIANQATDASRQAMTAPRAMPYSAKQGEIFAALRDRLNGLGLSDVRLTAEKVINPGGGQPTALIEGMYDPSSGNRVIALAMGIYDPKMTPDQLQGALSGVMNHEVIHALRNLGLFTDAEWRSLSELARRQKYMKIKGGKPTQRAYTYFQRAQRMYPNDTEEVQIEEAVAEMFRDYVDGKLKVGGKPRSLMERIKAFFNAIRGAHQDVGIDPNTIFEGIELGKIGGRDRAPPPPPQAAPAQARMSQVPLPPMLTVPAGTRAHKLPDILLDQGDGSKPELSITQKYAPSNADKNNANIDAALGSRPDALFSEEGWGSLMQETFGGDYLPKAPFVAVGYASNPNMVAEKIKGLTPALKDGVDRGFKHVQTIRDMYLNGEATPDMTADLFIWGILSRGAGPVQQESAYIDVIDAARPFVEKAIREPLTDKDIDLWKNKVSGALREGSPGKQVTMNVNAAGSLLQAMSQFAPNSNETVLQVVHDMMSDPTISGPEIRRWFLSNTEAAGIDNKVVSFILLVGGRNDVLVMDRIQSRHLWDDGRFGGMNIYDGIEGGGISQIMKGPRGLLVTEALERGLSASVREAYQRMGRPEDGTLGRFHWESWVIEGEQVVDHSTLAAIAARTPVGFSVTEGKMATFSSGSRYIRTEDGSVIEYPLSNGGYAYMRPTTFKEFMDAIRSGKEPDGSGNMVPQPEPVIPKKFKVTDRADIPWYERPEVNRAALDRLARRFEDAKSEGEIYGRDARTGEGTSADGGRAGIRRAGTEPGGRGDRGGRPEGRGLAPLEGAPRIQGASGPDLNLVRVAEDYARSIGIDLKRQSEFVQVDEDRARRIAQAYDEMKHDPQNPVVKEAYQNLINQTVAQYRALENAGYKFWFMDPENPGEYGSTPWNAMRDLRANKSMGVFPTAGGFGSGATDLDVNDNPMLADTGIEWPWGGPDGPLAPVLANDLFRAVHDAFGHGLEGAGFRARGEENAWQAHIRLFTGSAQGAITSETRGQNSWLNYGPYGEKNRNAKVEDTVFADQKTGIMPDWTWREGRAGDMDFPDGVRLSRLSVASPIGPQMQQNIANKQRSIMYGRSADVLGKILGAKGYGLKQDTVDNFLRKFQDSFLPVGRMVEELSKAGLNITDAMDPYLKEELMHGLVGYRIEQNQSKMYEPATKAIKKLNVSDAEIERLKRASDANAGSGATKGFVSLALEAGGSKRLALADAYLYAKHAKERNAYIRTVRDKTNDAGSGMTDAEADAILNWFNSLQGQNRQAVAEFDQIVRQIIADTNQTRLDAGLISQEVIDAGPNWQFYVPLRGVFDPDGDREETDGYKGPPGTPRYGAAGREDPRALGRYGAARDIVANVFTQNQNAIVRAERNKVGQSFLRLIEADPVAASGYAKILPRRPTTRGTNASTGENIEVVDQSAKNDPKMLVVKRDGKEVFVEFVDPRLAGAMNGRNSFSPGIGAGIINAMSKVNRYLASINTAYNPEFVITNALRDLQTAGVNMNQFDARGLVGAAMKGVAPAIRGIARSIMKGDDSSEWSKIYRDFVAAGGQNATNQFNSLSEQIDNIDTLLNDIAESGRRGAWVKMKNSFVGKGAGSLLQILEDANTAVENGVRVATYKALLDRGFTRERAAQAARNVTVNFAKGGDYRLLMNSMYLFYNASIQGTFAMLNAATRSAKVRKLWAGVVVAGILLDQMNAAMSEEDDDEELIYDKVPDYIAERNIILPDFFNVSDRSYISIPMPYGLNMAFNLGRQMSRVSRGASDPGEATGNVFSVAVDVLNPIGGTESFANAVAPTVFDPFIDMIENEDYADKPIYKEGLPFDRTPAPNSQMYWNSTSPSAKWIADNLNSLTGGNPVRPGFVDISPDVIEYWFSFLTGGVGRFVQGVPEAITGFATDGMSDDLVRTVPLLRKAIGAVSEREDTGEYIERASRVLMAGEELKQARESGDVQWARETIQRYQPELRLLGQVKAFETALRKISRQMNEIDKNPNLTDERKKALKDVLDQRKQMILSNANRMLRKLE